MSNSGEMPVSDAVTQFTKSGVIYRPSGVYRWKNTDKPGLLWLNEDGSLSTVKLQQLWTDSQGKESPVWVDCGQKITVDSDAPDTV